MYWNGDDGIARDPALAYVWADLAAERGNSHDLLHLRENI
jgi:TPR repeat protein